jgi:hypothetical protein
MAENKSSFILHRDIIHTVKKLTREQRGDLFLTILEYVNDENPKTEDPIIDLAFEPIKQSLKRDLKKWEGKALKRAESGVLGNLKRWHIDLYEKVSKEEMTLEDALVIANDRKTSQTSQTVANVAVSGSGSVSGSVSSNEDKKQASEPPAKIVSIIDRQKVLEYLREAAPIDYSQELLAIEADTLMDHYAGKKITNLKAVCNAWMGNVMRNPPAQIMGKRKLNLNRIV